MSKYFLIILVFWCQMREYAQSDSSHFPMPLIPDKQNSSETAEKTDKKLILNMNGHNNYYVGQIFNVYTKQLLSDNSDHFVTSGDGGVHKLHSRKRTWNDARKICHEEGGHLAVINSASEESVLLNMLKNKSLDSGWIGLHDLYQEGDWVSVLDQSLESTGYIRWTTKWPQEPDNYGGNQNCGALISPEGGVADMHCDTMYPFLCEIV